MDIPQKDWHKADVKAALEKAGWTLAKLSQSYGLHRDTFHIALERPYPKAEKAIAKVIGENPESIWPSRYLPENRIGKRYKRK